MIDCRIISSSEAPSISNSKISALSSPKLGLETEPPFLIVIKGASIEPTVNLLLVRLPVSSKSVELDLTSTKVRKNWSLAARTTDATSTTAYIVTVSPAITTSPPFERLIWAVVSLSWLSDRAFETLPASVKIAICSIVSWSESPDLLIDTWLIVTSSAPAVTSYATTLRPATPPGIVAAAGVIGERVISNSPLTVGVVGVVGSVGSTGSTVVSSSHVPRIAQRRSSSTTTSSSASIALAAHTNSCPLVTAVS